MDENEIKNKDIITPDRLRSFVFGVEDSLVSTVGLLSGIAIVGTPGKTIFLTGIILIFVEGLSMGVGNYLSEYSANSLLQKKEVSIVGPLTNGIIMFISYVAAGFIPLLPYLFTKPEEGLPISIIASLTFLFILGIFGSRLAKTPLWRGGLRMMIFGGLAISLGVIIGRIMA